MNCTRCNAPLVPGASFCRNCGLPVSTAVSQPASTDAAQTNQPGIGDSPTVPTPPWELQQPASFQPQYAPPQSIPPEAYQPTMPVSPSLGNMPSKGAQLPSPPLPKRRKNRFLQILLILAVALLVILLVLVAGWFVALRPYLHGVAQSDIDTVFSSAANQITPAEVVLISTSHAPVIITDTDANSFIALNTAPSDPIQQPHMTITPTGLRLDFQTYGFTSTITGVPQVVNGQLVITNVTVQGIASLIMSPDELTTTLNTHLHNIIAMLNHQVAGVQLKNHEMDIQLR